MHKIASRNSTRSIPIKSVTSCISPSSTKYFFTKERHIGGSLVKSITLSENTPARLTVFSSVIAIFGTVFYILCRL